MCYATVLHVSESYRMAGKSYISVPGSTNTSKKSLFPRDLYCGRKRIPPPFRNLYFPKNSVPDDKIA
jgi:hypothetical protein